jgi:hypothetical protein
VGAALAEPLSAPCPIPRAGAPATPPSSSRTAGRLAFHGVHRSHSRCRGAPGALWLPVGANPAPRNAFRLPLARVLLSETNAVHHSAGAWRTGVHRLAHLGASSPLSAGPICRTSRKLSTSPPTIGGSGISGAGASGPIRRTRRPVLPHRSPQADRAGQPEDDRDRRWPTHRHPDSKTAAQGPDPDRGSGPRGIPGATSSRGPPPARARLGDRGPGFNWAWKTIT